MGKKNLPCDTITLGALLEAIVKSIQAEPSRLNKTVWIDDDNMYTDFEHPEFVSVGDAYRKRNKKTGMCTGPLLEGSRVRILFGRD